MYKIGLIGAGRMGRRHLQAIRVLGHSIFGIVDSSPDSRTLAGRELGLDGKIMFPDTGSFYNFGIPDCVIVSTTANSHHDLVIEASELGVKYILVEKPMAVSLGQCCKMIEFCEKNGSLLSVNHQMRFMDQYSKVRKFCESEGLGGLCSMSVISGNMGLAMNCCHYFEAFRFLAGEDIESVRACLEDEELPNPRGIQFKDKAGFLQAETRSGKRLHVEFGSDQGNGISVIYGCRLGQIYVDELTGNYVIRQRKAGDRNLPTTRYGMESEYTRGDFSPVEVVYSSAEVLKALLADENRVTGHDGLKVVKTLVSCYQSSHLGGAKVRVDDLDCDETLFSWA